MGASTLFGPLFGLLAGVTLCLLLFQGNACVTWFQDLSSGVVLAFGVIGLLLGAAGDAIWGAWAAADGADGDSAQRRRVP